MPLTQFMSNDSDLHRLKMNQAINGDSRDWTSRDSVLIASWFNSVGFIEPGIQEKDLVFHLSFFPELNTFECAPVAIDEAANTSFLASEDAWVQ